MNERDELAEQIGGFIEAYTGYGRDEGKRGWSVDVRHTSRIVADVDSLIAEIIELVRADERQLKGAGLQTEIAAWARETFGPNYGFNDLHKLFDEMEELKRAALVYGAESQAMNDPEPMAVANEAADVMHMLFQLAHNLGFDLLEETRKKFEINKQRAWEPRPDGTFQHVSEASDAS